MKGLRDDNEDSQEELFGIEDYSSIVRRHITYNPSEWNTFPSIPKVSSCREQEHITMDIVCNDSESIISGQMTKKSTSPDIKIDAIDTHCGLERIPIITESNSSGQILTDSFSSKGKYNQRHALKYTFLKLMMIYGETNGNISWFIKSL